MLSLGRSVILSSLLKAPKALPTLQLAAPALSSLVLKPTGSFMDSALLQWTQVREVSTKRRRSTMMNKVRMVSWAM